jgi:hypothetical protein
MKKTILAAGAVLCFCFLTGCSPVKIYSNPDLTNKTGIKYYTAKPFLQVEKDQASNSIVKATIVYLPDLANPQYLAIKDGPGSRKVDIKLVDGMISTFGTTSDPQLDDAVEALAALISKGTSAVTDIAGLKGVPTPTASQTVSELYEIIMDSEGTTLKKVVVK